MAGRERPTFIDLPPEIRMDVFTRLQPRVSDLLSLSMTCSSLREETRPVLYSAVRLGFTRVDGREPSYLQIYYFSFLRSHCGPWIRDLVLSQIRAPEGMKLTAKNSTLKKQISSSILAPMRRLPAIRKLMSREAKVDDRDKILPAPTKRLTTDMLFLIVLALVPRLEKVIVRGASQDFWWRCFSLRPSGIEWTHTFDRLRDIEISFANWDEYPIVIEAIQTLLSIPTLHTLKLSGSCYQDPVPDSSTSEAWSKNSSPPHTTSLTVLILDDVELLSNHIDQIIDCTQYSLTHFTIRNCLGWNRAFFDSLVKSLARVDSTLIGLSMSATGEDGEQSFPAPELTRFTALTTLTIESHLLGRRQQTIGQASDTRGGWPTLPPKLRELRIMNAGGLGGRHEIGPDVEEYVRWVIESQIWQRESTGTSGLRDIVLDGLGFSWDEIFRFRPRELLDMVKQQSWWSFFELSEDRLRRALHEGDGNPNALIEVGMTLLREASQAGIRLRGETQGWTIPTRILAPEEDEVEKPEDKFWL